MPTPPFTAHLQCAAEQLSNDYELHQVYDAQADDLLAYAAITNGKKHGLILDQSYNGDRFIGGDDSWEAAIVYMYELMADPRK